MDVLVQVEMLHRV